MSSRSGAGSSKDELEKRGRVLTSKVPAVARSIADAIVLKDGNVFLVANQRGNIPVKGPHGFGLYYHDCRFLSGYVLELDGRTPIVLGSSAPPGYRGIVELTNPVLPRPGGGKVGKHELAVRWERVIDGDRRALHDVIRLRNFGADPVDVEITLAFRADFLDLFAVRGIISERPGTLHPPRCEEDALRLVYDGKDGLRRTTLIRFWRRPDGMEEKRARFFLHVEAEAEEEVALSVLLFEQSDHQDEEPSKRPVIEDVVRARQAAAQKRAAGLTDVRTSSRALERTLRRSLLDLSMLRSSLEGEIYSAAGVPWFTALFGRDSLVVALEAIAYDPRIAEETLRLLARHQATKLDPSCDAEPGKILHELRVGELAHIGAIPHSPYYGTVDATPLFLVLVARHAAWTGTLDLFRELRPNVDAALDWISSYGLSKKTGFVEYHSPASGGLANQGWKDSGDAIVMKDGSLAKQPIALVEVQGYAYLAWMEIASLLDRAGEPGRAARLRQEAEALAERFARAFWLEDEGFLALALTAGGPAAVLSSNPGQALWTGIVRPEHARRTVESLFSAPMWTGWGIRTLSAETRRYNPVAYHRGTVWPHDNAIIAAGLRRHRYDEAARRVFSGILDASTYFPLHRLPELFSGFRREEYEVPIRYPVACHPQAWAAGSIPFMLSSLLGLEPEAFDRRLRIVRPTLPDGVDDLALQGLRVGASTVDLSFERRADGDVEVRVLANEGGIEVKVERE